MTINGIEIKVLAGSSTNIISFVDFKKIQPPPQLKSTSCKIFSYASPKLLVILGYFDAVIQAPNGSYCTSKINVIKGNTTPLLGLPTCQQLEILKTSEPVNHITSNPEQLFTQYPEVFEDRIGKMKDVKIKLHIDESIRPVAQPHRRIPFLMRKKVEKELERLQNLDIIRKAEGPTPWISPVVIVPKGNDEIRICIDNRCANQAIQRERHVTPTLDDLINDLNGAMIFSKIDLKNGYHQLELDEESKYITTFSTHIGIFQYNRLHFGINSASEIFQHQIANLIQGIQAKNYSDDIIVYGKSETGNIEEARRNHDENLSKLLQRLKENNVTANAAKCSFHKTNLKFHGYIFSQDGISADPEKLQALKDAKPPLNPKEVRSFLGMANYIARFIPDFATISEPLRLLTHKNSTWKWDEAEKKSFCKIKTSLTNNVSYFDPNLETELVVDASPVGLGCLLTQKEANNKVRVIAYASRALTPVEQRYSQIEREALAIIWATEHFHLYLFGTDFCIITDHNPLETIFTRTKSSPSARIERWLLRMQPYSFRVKYRPGENNPSDYLSRHPMESTQISSRQQKVAEDYIQQISLDSVPKSLTLSDIKTETMKDPTLLLAISCMQHDKWYNLQETSQIHFDKDMFQSLEKVKSSLSTDGNILLRNNQLVIPKSLQDKCIDLAHEGHLGIVKTNQLLRQKIWFPGIDAKVEAKVRNCISCQSCTDTHTQEPLRMSDCPDAPWIDVSIDFFGPTRQGDYLLVIVDDFSRFPIVEFVSSTSAKSTIPTLDKVFSEYGIPKTVRSDNSPPFNSHDFHAFATNLGFKHRKITPLWPRANGICEQFMKNIGKVLKTSHVENKNFKQELYSFLRNYRQTPHSTTGIPPSLLMFSRQTESKLPSCIPTPLPHQQSLYNETKLNDYTKKQKMKENADNNNSKPSTINIGDTVLVKQFKVHKQTPPFDPQPLIVTNKKESMITASRGNMDRTRNSSFFKKISPQIPLVPDLTEDDDIVLQPSDSETPAVRDKSTESNSFGPSTELQVELPCSPPKQAERPAPPAEPHCHTRVPHTRTPYITKSGRVVRKPNKYTE